MKNAVMILLCLSSATSLAACVTQVDESADPATTQTEVPEAQPEGAGAVETRAIKPGTASGACSDDGKVCCYLMPDGFMRCFGY